MFDSRINHDQVLDAIYDKRNHRRVIWTASTTLGVMGVEHYPHSPPANYRHMIRVLKELCEEGWLVQRPNLHSHFTLKEVAYERVKHTPSPRRNSS